MKFNEIHPDFQLNGTFFTKEVLEDAAYSFIKEGELYEKAIGDFLCDWLDSSATIEVHTSGSTGTPERIVLQKQHMVNSALATGEFFHLQPGNLALLCLSAEYIAGKMMLVRAMILGLHLDSMAPVSNPLKGNEKAYDFGAMVPMQLLNSIQQIGQVKTLLVGGGPVSLSVKKELNNATSHIFETYGMTETITHVAIKEIGTALNSAKESKSFMALPNVTFSKDKRSCLVIDAPKVSDEKIITNDVVYLISKTEFEWLGRFDNIINSGGVKLFPERIEEKLATVIDQRFFVAGMPDEKFGQRLVLLIQGEVNSNAVLEGIQKLASLKKYEIPKEVFGLKNFVYTLNDKINRNLTLKLFSSLG